MDHVSFFQHHLSVNNITFSLLRLLQDFYALTQGQKSSRRHHPRLKHLCVAAPRERERLERIQRAEHADFEACASAQPRDLDAFSILAARSRPAAVVAANCDISIAVPVRPVSDGDPVI